MASEDPLTPVASRRSNHRPPAPALFVGPPSRRSSNADIRRSDSQIFGTSELSEPDPQPHAGPSNLPSFSPTLPRQRSERRPSHPTDGSDPTHLQVPHLSSAAPPAPRPPQAQPRPSWRPPPADEAADAQWKAMQSTLAEVELSAAAGGTNVFSAAHARALEELRRAQVALAQAWGRGEADEEEGAEGAGGEVASAARRTMGGGERGQMDDETENDILLARRRRQANDRYFEKINKGVVDVVERLQVVAAKMGDVETESQEIWGDGDSVQSNANE